MSNKRLNMKAPENLTDKERSLADKLLIELWFKTLRKSIEVMELPADQVKAAQLAQCRGFLLDNEISQQTLDPMKAHESMQGLYGETLMNLPEFDPDTCEMTYPDRGDQ